MSDPIAKPVVERLYREAIRGRSATAITKAQFELLVEKAVAKHHAMPNPFPSNAGDPSNRLRCKAAAERLERHVVKAVSILDYPGDDA